MVQDIGYRHGTRTVIPEAIAAASAPSAHELVFRRALGGDQESTTTSGNGILTGQTLFPSPTSTPSPAGKQGVSQVGADS